MIGDRLLRVMHHVLIALLVVGSTIVLSAQTVLDPRYVEFNPSPDHNATATDGTPLVQRYSLLVFAAGSSVAFDTMDLGKPAAGTNGIIQVDFLPLLHVPLTPGVVFEARVAAVGPGGSTNSTVSNTFSVPVACAPAISPTSLSMGSGGGTGSVGVTAGAGCMWSAASNAGWITFTGATSGTGNGSVPYSVTANTTQSQRIGTLTIAGQTFTVTQAAVPCTFLVAPTSQSVAAGGGTGSTIMTAPSGCAWTAVSNNTGWLTVTSGASGNGNGTVNFSATANPNTQARSGTLTIAAQTFTVNQSAGSCSFSISPTSQSAAASGGTGSTTVTTTSGCAWTAVSNAAWITVTAGASASGNGSASFSVAATTSSSQRSGTLTIAGRTFTVTQAANTCNYVLTPPNRTMPPSGGTGNITVSTGAGCAWTATTSASWISVSGSGSTSGSASYTVTANTTGSSRTGTISIGNQVFTITQGSATAPAGPRNLRIVVVGGG